MSGTPDPAQQFADLKRLVENIVRVGTIVAVDHDTTPPMVRVQLSEKAISDWRPYVEQRAGDTGSWNPPTVGECVLFFSPGGETAGGFALAGVPTARRPTPSADRNKTVTKYPDGAVIEYDHAAHALNATLPAGGTADITAPGSVTVHSDAITLDAPQTTITGMLMVLGLFTWVAGMVGSGAGPGGGTAEIDGTVRTTEDVIAAGISLAHHDHVEGVGGPV